VKEKGVATKEEKGKPYVGGEAIANRGCWLVLVLVGFLEEQKKRQGAATSLREDDSLGFACPFLCFFCVFL